MRNARSVELRRRHKPTSEAGMKLRIANKVLRNALNTGVVPNGETLRRAVAAFPCGARHHPERTMAGGYFFTKQVKSFCE